MNDEISNRVEGRLAWLIDQISARFPSHSNSINIRPPDLSALDVIDREIKKRDEEIKRLREELVNAADLIQEWGKYADLYFQENWNLARDVQQVRDDATIKRLVEQCIAIKLSGLANPVRFQFTSSELHTFAKACCAAGYAAAKEEPNVGHMIDKQCICEMEKVIEKLLDSFQLIVCEPINAEGIAQDALDEWRKKWNE